MKNNKVKFWANLGLKRAQNTDQIHQTKCGLPHLINNSCEKYELSVGLGFDKMNQMDFHQNTRAENNDQILDNIQPN